LKPILNSKEITDMGNVLTFLLARAKEPSTWAAAAGALGYFGLHPSDGTLEAVAQVATGAAALLGIALAERGQAPKAGPPAPPAAG
jgi:hypothetical protein